MGINALGGIISSIFSGLMDFVMMIFEKIMTIVMQYIISPLLMMAIRLISYSVSFVLYRIATFLLALIDYVEMLFRMLAGLETANGAQLTFSGSTTDSPDLLLQLILHPDIGEVFLSMCIVGLFLLIITTVFQMIKVEYTTEGAKNAKGPILGKAFKGICNIVLLPVLVVFGVFLGNQVLDLMDKATKADGDNPTISGQLFVTAASDAFYYDTDLPVVLATTEPSMATAQILMNILPITVNTIQKMWADTFAPNWNRGRAFTAEERKTIEEAFVNKKRMSVISGNFLDSGASPDSSFLMGSPKHTYFNIGLVTQYYDYSQISYMLLFFGGIMCIKTLYYSCFGMVVRLYQCGMLFIIAPAVIGMTPVNEGNLGKWRTKFIGQCLSAYGVILALNIFFILVRIFLQMEFSFDSLDPDDQFFGSSLMIGILKGIFVIAGTIMVEKFSKEIGGYFGADDALSQGKEMEKGVMDSATKGIKAAIAVAGVVATGGAGAVAMAGNLASKMSSGAKASKAAGKSGFVGGIKGAFGIQEKGEAEGMGLYKASLANQAKSEAAIDEIDKRDARRKELSSRDRDTLSKEEKSELISLNQTRSNDVKARKLLQQDVDKEVKFQNSDEAKGILAKQAELNDYNAGIQKRKAEKKEARRDKIDNFKTNTTAMFVGAGDTIMQDFGPKAFNDLSKFGKDKISHVGKYDDNVKKAQEAGEERHKKKLEDTMGTLPWSKHAAESQKAITMQKVETLVVSNADNLFKEATREMENIMTRMSQMGTRKKELEDKAKNKKITQAEQVELGNLTQSLNDMINNLVINKGVDASEITVNQNGKYEFTGKLGLDPKDVQKAFAEAIKEHGDLNDGAVQQILEKLNPKGNADLYRAIEKLIQKTISQLNSAK